MNGDKELKTIPVFKTDEEAERFVDEANLTEYDLSGFQPMQFEFEPKSAHVNMRVPQPLLDAVVDYGHVVAAVRALVESAHFHLIETLAERIAESCLADVRVHVARITIEKPDILPGCRSVGIAIERGR